MSSLRVVPLSSRREHGYVFEVAADGMGNAEPLYGLGRFNHEAAAVDPATSIVYQTEDRGDSLLYRFIPAATAICAARVGSKRCFCVTIRVV